MGNHVAECLTLTAKLPRRSEHKSKLKLPMKPCPSKGKAPIYLALVRVAFKKAKRTYERDVQVVTVFDTPHEIMKYGKHTMQNLEEHFYGKNYKSQKQVIVRDVLSKKFISNSNLSIDEHKEQYQK